MTDDSSCPGTPGNSAAPVPRANESGESAGVGKPKKHWIRRLIWAVVILLVLVGVLLVAAPRIASSGWGKARMEAAAGDALAGSVTLERLGLSWFGSQTVGGFTLTDPDGANVVTFDELTVDASLFALATGSRDLGTVRITGLVADVNADEQGQTNLQRAVAAEAPAEPATPAETDEPFRLPVTGTVEIISAKARIAKPGFEPVDVDDLNATLRISSLGGPLDLKFSATPTQGRLAGNVSVDATIGGFDQTGALRPEALTVSAKVNIADLPVEGLDTLLSMNGLLAAALGDRLDIDLVTRRHDDGTQAVQFSAEAANLVVTSRSSIDQNLAARGSGRISFKVTPAFALALAKRAAGEADAPLGHPVLIELDLQRFVAPVGPFDPSKIALAGKLTASDGHLTFAEPVGRVAWSNASAQVDTQNLAQRVEFAVSADTQAGGTDETAPTNGAVRVAGSAAELFDDAGRFQPDRLAVDADANLTSLPVGLIDTLAGQGGLLVEAIGEQMNVEVTATSTSARRIDAVVTVSSTGLDARVPLTLTERVALTEPATVDLRVARKVVDRYLAADSPVHPQSNLAAHLVIDSFSLPRPAAGEPFFQPARTQLHGTLTLDAFELPGLVEDARTTVKSLSVNVNVDGTEAAAFNAAAELKFSLNGALALLGGPAAKLTAGVDGSLAPPFDFSIAAVTLSAVSEEMDIDIDLGLEDGVVHLRRPAKIHTTVSPGLMTRLGWAPDGKPVLGEPVRVRLNIKRGSMPVEPMSLEKAEAQLALAIDAVRLADVPQVDRLTLTDTSATAELRQGRLTAKLTGKTGVTLAEQTHTGTIDASVDLASALKGMKLRLADAKGTITAAVHDLPTALVDTLAEQDGLIAAAIGPMVHLKATYQPADEGAIDLVVNGQHLALDAGLKMRDGLTATRPAKIDFTLTPALFARLTEPAEGGEPAAITLIEPVKMTGRMTRLNLPARRDGRGGFRPAEAAMVASLSAEPAPLRQTDTDTTIILRNLAGSVDATELAKGAKVQLAADISRTGAAQPGKLDVAANLTDLFDRQGLFNREGLSVDLSAEATQLPLALVDELGGFDGLMPSALGQTANVQATAKLQRMTGPITLDLSAEHARAHVDGRIADGFLTLTRDATAEFTVTEALSRRFINHPLLRQAVRSQQPVTITLYAQADVEANGQTTRLPLRVPVTDFHLNALQLPRATIDPGQMVVRNAGLIKLLTDLPQRLSRVSRGRKPGERATGDEMVAWFTPVDLSLIDGVARYSRMEMLLGSDYQIATWGTLNLSDGPVTIDGHRIPAGHGRMMLGLAERSLRRVYGIALYEDQPNYVDQFPMTGPIDTLGPDRQDMIGRITLLTTASATGKGGDQIIAIGTLADRLLRRASDQERDWDAPPPPRKPFPWPEEQKPAEGQQTPEQPQQQDQAAPKKSQAEQTTEPAQPKRRPEDELRDAARKALEDLFGN